MEKLNTKGMECIKVWRWHGLQLRLWDADNGQVAYRLRQGKETIFEGGDFQPSPLNAIYSMQAVCDLLMFLTAQEQDVGDEYFGDYTKRQLEWRESDLCQELQNWLYDRENRMQS